LSPCAEPKSQQRPCQRAGRQSQPSYGKSATGREHPPFQWLTDYSCIEERATERRSPKPLREGGCPNRCRCVAPSKRRRLGTVALPTATERRSSQPLRNGGCPNRCGRAVVPTAADAWHRPNDGDWGQSPSQPLREGGCPNRCRYIAVAQTPDHATHTNSFNSFSIGAAIDSPTKPKRRSVYTFIAFLTEIRHCPSSIQ